MTDMIIDLLPPEIKTDIFSRLPLDSVIKCKLLCKTWRTLIDELLHDPSFISKHTFRLLSSPASYNTSFLARENFYNVCSQSPIRDDHNDDHLSIVGSCNGLVCLATDSKRLQDHNVYICNPVTREYVVDILPQSNHYLKKEWPQWKPPRVVATGFGYHPCTKEYKFVRITRYAKLKYVSVYTLGSGRWSTKKVEFLYSKHCKLKFHNKRKVVTGILFNGVLYWSTLSPNGSIVSFELDTEEFRLVPSPAQSQDKKKERFVDDDEDEDEDEDDDDELGVLGGCFCVIRPETRDGSKDIWVMNKEEDEDEEESYTWTKKFRIKPSKGYQIQRAITPFVRYEKYLSSYFYMKFDSYDPNTRRLNRLIGKNTTGFRKVDNRCDILPYMSRFEMIPHMRSLVSLKALGEDSHFVVRRERKRKRNQEEEIAM